MAWTPLVLVRALQLLSILLWVYISISNTLWMATLSFGEYLGIEFTGLHHEVSELARVLANIPWEKSGVALARDHASLFFVNHRLQLGGMWQYEGIENFRDSVLSGRYLVFDDSDEHVIELNDTFSIETKKIDNPSEMFWRFIAPISENGMNITMIFHEGELPGASLGTHVLGNVVTFNRGWKNNESRIIAEGSSTNTEAIHRIISSVRDENAACYKSNELHEKKGLRLHRLWGGIYTVHSDYFSKDNYVKDQGVVIDDPEYAVCFGLEEIKYSVDIFRAVWSMDKRFEGVLHNNADIRIRPMAVTSNEMLKLAKETSLEDGLFEIPLRDFLVLPVDGTVHIHPTKFVVGTRNPLVSVTIIAQSVVFLILAVTYSYSPKRDVMFWVNIITESPSAQWVYGLGSIGAMGASIQWIHSATMVNNGYAFSAILRNVLNYAWIVKGPGILCMLIVRLLVSMFHSDKYVIFQLSSRSSSLPTLLASSIMYNMVMSSTNSLANNLQSYVIAGIFLVIASYCTRMAFDRYSHDSHCGSKNSLCYAVNRRLFSIIAYSGVGLRVKLPGYTKQVISVDSSRKLAACVLIDKSIWSCECGVLNIFKNGRYFTVCTRNSIEDDSIYIGDITPKKKISEYESVKELIPRFNSSRIVQAGVSGKKNSLKLRNTIKEENQNPHPAFISE